MGGVQRLTDTSKYTGAHKERFNADGTGKGIEGREDLTKNDGYVPHHLVSHWSHIFRFINKNRESGSFLSVDWFVFCWRRLATWIIFSRFFHNSVWLMTKKSLPIPLIIRFFQCYSWRWTVVSSLTYFCLVNLGMSDSTRAPTPTIRSMDEKRLSRAKTWGLFRSICIYGFLVDEWYCVFLIKLCPQTFFICRFVFMQWIQPCLTKNIPKDVLQYIKYWFFWINFVKNS